MNFSQNRHLGFLKIANNEFIVSFRLIWYMGVFMNTDQEVLVFYHGEQNILIFMNVRRCRSRFDNPMYRLNISI